jgi:uncharacterized protein (DUF2345 family)
MASSGGNSTNNNSGDKTEDTFDVPGDNRAGEQSGKYPDYMSYKSRSGHNFIFDDTKGQESVTLQHRGGSAVQMRSDGSLHITAHNSMYTVTFGENRMTVTGANDITVKGDASLRVYGDYNVTVHKNYNLTVMGDYNFTSKNLNRHIRGNMDTQAKNETKKLEGSSAKLARGGIAQVAKGPVSVISQGGSASFGGSDGLNLAVTKKGKLTLRNESGEITTSAKQGGIQVRGDESVIVSSLNGSINANAKQNIGLKAQQSAKLEGQTAGLVGQSAAHVTAATVHVKGQSATNVDGSKVNLAGGLAMPMPALDIAQAVFQRVAGAKADQPKEEPDHESEIKNWV